MKTALWQSAVSSVLALGVVGDAAAQGQPTCMPRAQLVERLTEAQMQQLSSGGLVGPTRLIEIWTEGEGESFTIILTEASGRSCILASGRSWTEFPEDVMTMMRGMKS